MDFFVNNNPEFEIQVKKIVEFLNSQSELTINIQLSSSSFFRILVIKDDVALKVEFINDVGYHKGDFIQTPLFYKTDNPINIISNKITALPRVAGRDISDIIYLSLNYQFEWIEIMNDAKNKDAWINEIYCSQYLENITANSFADIKWIFDINI